MADRLKAEILAIRRSGLFLTPWYLSRHGELAARGEDGVEHFCRAGWRQDAMPNPYFQPAWYLAQNPDVAQAGANPLLHYIAIGEAEGRDPCGYFQVRWYRATYGLSLGDGALKHFLARRESGAVNPVPVFDAAFYLEDNPDVAAAGADPFVHFLSYGAPEGRKPAADFDTVYYTGQYAAQLNGQNPLLHYLANRESGLFLPERPARHRLVAGEVKRATRQSADFEAFQPVPAQAARRAKLLAYYLPQFHAVPENDAWWGKGFTDWTNLGRASPRFSGHLQPRVPRDLGYYSLDDETVLRRQIALAQGAGIYGFVFYTYWFNGRRLLEKPLEQLLAEPAQNFPFCVMWANENWTRRWDGLEKDVLIAQDYRASDDAAFVDGFARLFADARYIRLQGRPLFMIYRVTLIPDARARIAIWREMFRARHGEDPVIIMAQSLGDYDPLPYGLDGAIEFPPHKLSQETPRIGEGLHLLDPDFNATVHDYGAIAQTSLALPAPDYPLIKTIVPGWDNDPRREGKGLVLHGASPGKYQAWLENLVRYAGRHEFFGERLIAVNAWNEWAEGAFLEPDIHFGAAFLNATGRAICRLDSHGLSAGLLLVGHDAQAHGAQLLLLHVARRLRRQWGIEVQVLLLGVGPLLADYHATAQVSIAYDKTSIGRLLDKYRDAGIRHAIVNSAASARVVAWAEARGIGCSLLVHELPQLLKEYNLEVQARLGGGAAKTLVFSSAFLAEKFCAAVQLQDTRKVILPQGNYQNIGFDADARARIRRELGLGAAAFLVIGAGFGHIRKGFDLFLQLARKFAERREDVRFVWVGDIEFMLKTYLGPEMAAAVNFHHVPFTEQVGDYFSAADVLALTSREDPYPSVVLEALGAGVPCVAFEGAGGIPELLRREAAGAVARISDVDDFLARLEDLLDHPRLEQWRPRLAAMAARNFDFGNYVESLLRLSAPELVTLSVCVLSYNYARHMPGRLNSVFAQTYPVAEILLFDDASSDDSVAVAQAAAAQAGRTLEIVTNTQNSGSVFAQWLRAARQARCEFIWLAEADDDAAPEFLARLVAAMAGAKDVLLALSDARAIDAAGATISASYQSYYFESGVKELATSGIWDGREFARRFLGVKNLILNASGVLWRRTALLAALEHWSDMADWQLAGDWLMYLAVLTSDPGQVVYVAEPLNVHRRHASAVTQRLPPQAHVAEIARAQAVAAQALALDDDKRAEQAEYLARVAAQLGVATKPTKAVARKRRV